MTKRNDHAPHREAVKRTEKTEPDGDKEPEKLAEPSKAQPRISPKAMEGMPKEIQEMFSFGMSSGPFLRGPDALRARIPEDQTGQALTRILDASEAASKRNHEETMAEMSTGDRQHKRGLYFGGVILFLVVGLIIVCLAMGKDEMVAPLVSGLAGLIAGGLGGYGLGRMRD